MATKVLFNIYLCDLRCVENIVILFSNSSHTPTLGLGETGSILD